VGDARPSNTARGTGNWHFAEVVARKRRYSGSLAPSPSNGAGTTRID
jgi:hypothetical protein